jgi:hypothetical protein
MLFFIDYENKIIFGWSAKCGCSHVKNIFFFLTTNNIPEYIHNPENDSLPDDIENYTTIIIIRNPYKRLVSGFLDKYSEYGEFRKYWLLPTLVFSQFVDELINNFELNVYIKKEIEKKIFEECYYLKYYKSIKALKIYGDNFIHVENWGGWNGSENIVDGCSKPVMYKFIKYYKLTNPMTINKLYRQDNDQIDKQPSAPEVPLARDSLVLPTSHIKNNTFNLEHIINSYKPRQQNLPKIQNKKNKRNIILDMLVAEMNDKMNKENDEEIKKKINMLLTENNEV